VFAKEKGKLDEKAFASHFYLKKWNQTFYSHQHSLKRDKGLIIGSIVLSA